ncbi:stage II sporulation protein D [Bacillus infantis]|uniref:Stage II sporulation protein D n=1 Tax=Bacillus infantis TaxID=324767 RepID=A0A5D4R6H9_9BACI|nr:stage II sporulation protein D [Bacillus infantis]TYS46995.1 stage II sporulation protein D [Bacillus infantis]
MIKFKPILLLSALLLVTTLMIPTLLVLPFKDAKVSGKLGEELQQQEKPPAAAKPAGPAIDVSVYRTMAKKVETLPLEDYVVGVVASEMPADFEKEALKAQALTARTYIVRQMMGKVTEGLPDGAIVTDTENHQVYKNEAELKKLWKENYSWKIKNIREAVNETSGQILTYEGKPIEAQFFSTANGYTESSEEVWSNAMPYLKSVESPWDVGTPKYQAQKEITVAEFEAKLGVKLPADNTIGTVIERTAGKRVGKVDINGKVLEGTTIRTDLGLRSTDFTWERKGNNIVITTKGFGHGVGMSQYGANGMAAEGKTFKDIVTYYYKGVEIASADQALTKITAQK